MLPALADNKSQWGINSSDPLLISPLSDKSPYSDIQSTIIVSILRIDNVPQTVIEFRLKSYF